MIKKRIVSILLLALLIPAVAFAATWTWTSKYEGVTDYRYQIGSESEDGWIYVDKDTKSITLDSKNPTVVYVQLSVDGGKTWSPSGSAFYDPTVPFVPESEKEEVVELVPVSTGYTYTGRTFNMNFFAGSEYVGKKNVLSTGLAFDFVTYKPADFFDLDVKFDMGALFEPTIDGIKNPTLMDYFKNLSNLKMSYGAFSDLSLIANFYLGGFNFGLGGGGGASFIYGPSESYPTLYSIKDFNLSPYIHAIADVDIHIGKSGTFSVTYKLKYLFDQDMANNKLAHALTVGMGFGL